MQKSQRISTRQLNLNEGGSQKNIIVKVYIQHLRTSGKVWGYYIDDGVVRFESNVTCSGSHVIGHKLIVELQVWDGDELTLVTNPVHVNMSRNCYLYTCDSRGTIHHWEIDHQLSRNYSEFCCMNHFLLQFTLVTPDEC